MPEKEIILHCSPTLAGLKTGNLFLSDYKNSAVLQRDVAQWNARLGQKGLRFTVLRARNGRALIYAYRLSRLKETLSDTQVALFLAEHGYPAGHLEGCLTRLCVKLAECENFPHEIGVFLGYPLGDIKAFIANAGANCKCAGAWKAYSDEQAAEKTFSKYKKCTQIYCKKHAEGIGIDRLAVAM
jgi:hypothetical protein